jgi:lantibiotic modifying enzyme
MQLETYLWGFAPVAPLFAVYLLAVVLGLVNLPTHRAAAAFTALGGTFGMLVMIGANVTQYILWEKSTNFSKTIEANIRLSRSVDIGAGVLYAVSMLVILSAVFVGRKPKRRQGVPAEPAPHRAD